MLNVLVLRETFTICRLSAHLSVPEWAGTGSFLSMTRTPEELSIVCREDAVPPDTVAENGWRCPARGRRA